MLKPTVLYTFRVNLCSHQCKRWLRWLQVNMSLVRASSDSLGIPEGSPSSLVPCRALISRVCRRLLKSNQ